MAEGFEYVAKIKDEVSGPANEIKKSLHGIGTEIKQTHGALSELKSHLVGSVTAGSLLAGGIEKIAETAKEAAVEIGALVKEGFQFAIEAREFKEQMTEGFELFLDSKEAGEETFAEVQKIATALHAPIEQVGGLTNQLLTAGLDNQAQLTETVEAITALQRVKGAEAAGKVQNIVQRSIASGQFKLSPKMISGTGTTLDALSEILSKKLGVSAKVAKAQLQQGKINVETGIAALDEAFLKGKIGERAKGMFKLADIGVDFKNTMTKIFENVDVAPFLDALKQVAVLFDENSASGKMLRGVILGTFNTLMAVAGKAIKAITLGFIWTQVYILRVANKFPGLIKWLYKLYDAKTVLTVIKIALGALAVAAALVILPFVLMAAAGIAAFTLIVAAVKAIPDAFTSAWTAIKNFWASLDFKQIGLDIVNGIVEGIKAAANFPADAIKGVVSSAIDTAKKALGAHSPSEEFAKLGEYTSEGYAMGVERGAPMAHRAVNFAVGSPDKTSGASGGVGKQITVNVGGVEIHGVKGAEEMAPMFETMFTDLLERVAIEVGG